MTTTTFPAKFEYLDEIRDLVAEVARRGGFNEKEVYSLQLAADEAASNIIEHAYAGLNNGVIQISCEMDGDKIVITMNDQGKPFDPSAVKQPDVNADLSERQIGGLGVYLMRKIMDEVRYHASETGNTLLMTKRKG